MDRPLQHLPVGPTDTQVAATVTRALTRALDGSGPAVAPAPAADRDGGRPAEGDVDAGPAPQRRAGGLPGVPGDVVLAVATSGSTGRPRRVLLDGAALLSSATATHDRLGGPGRWVLALPLAHVAGLQVLVRSLVAGTTPVVLPAADGFQPARFADAVAEALRSPADGPVYTSLVPTQLHRVVAAAEDGDLHGLLAALRRLSAILVGGAALAPALRRRARDLGLPVVTTYGMTETCGGCVYDGLALDGVAVRLRDGVVQLAGPVLARGYLGGDERSADPTETTQPTQPTEPTGFTVQDGVRWFRTGDLGRWTDGRLEVLGRRDDVLVTGGHKVAPSAVEAVLATLPGIGEVSVVGVPDAEWGQAVTAVVVGARHARLPELAEVRAAVGRTLGPAAAPRHLVVVAALPERGPGKMDRSAVAHLAAQAVRDQARGTEH